MEFLLILYFKRELYHNERFIYFRRIYLLGTLFMLILANLIYDKVVPYVREKLIGEMYFSSLIATDFDLNKGDFFTVIPNNLPEDVVYRFDNGGYVYPFKRNEGETVVKTENVSREILDLFINQFISTEKSNCLGLEDFSASPNAPYVKKSNMKYSIIGDRLFYLLDNEYPYDAISRYLNFAGGYIFLGFFLNLNDTDIEKVKNGSFNEMPKEVLDAIYQGIEGFFLEVYDGESYLFWIKKDRKDILQLLQQSIDTKNQ